MPDYELNMVRAELAELKENLYSYLLGSYQNDPSGPEAAAERTFNYLKDVVDRVIKHKGFRIQWSNGGSTIWHSKVLLLLSNWIEAEHRYNLLLAKEFSEIDET